MVKSRQYKILEDFQRVSDFLFNEYGKQDYHELVQPFFEYSQTHTCFDYQLAHRCRIWEDDGKIVAFICYEYELGDVYLLASKDYNYLYDEMLEYAEEKLAGMAEDGKKYVAIFWNSLDEKMKERFVQRGYKNVYTEPNLIYDYSKGFEHKPLPEGYKIITLEDENDIAKIDKCLYLGFDHGTEEEYYLQREPEDIDGRATMQTGPHYRKDLVFVVKSAEGEYVSLAAMWLDEKNHYTYLEPLATVPEHRKKGLATILLMEAMKKTAQYGAKYCIGGSIDYYKNIGFEQDGEELLWMKKW